MKPNFNVYTLLEWSLIQVELEARKVKVGIGQMPKNYGFLTMLDFLE